MKHIGSMKRIAPMKQDEIDWVESQADTKNESVFTRTEDFYICVTKARDGVGTYLLIRDAKGRLYTWTYGADSAILKRAAAIRGKVHNS